MSERRFASCEIRGGASAAEAAAVVAVIHDVLARESLQREVLDDVRLTDWVRSGIRRPLAGPAAGWRAP